MVESGGSGVVGVAVGVAAAAAGVVAVPVGELVGEGDAVAVAVGGSGIATFFVLSTW